jgi:hypothetical protein
MESCCSSAILETLRIVGLSGGEKEEIRRYTQEIDAAKRQDREKRKDRRRTVLEQEK